jgi:hypothetical protein
MPRIAASRNRYGEQLRGAASLAPLVFVSRGFCAYLITKPSSPTTILSKSAPPASTATGAVQAARYSGNK